MGSPTDEQAPKGPHERGLLAVRLQRARRKRMQRVLVLTSCCTIIVALALLTRFGVWCAPPPTPSLPTAPR